MRPAIKLITATALLLLRGAAYRPIDFSLQRRVSDGDVISSSRSRRLSVNLGNIGCGDRYAMAGTAEKSSAIFTSISSNMISENAELTEIKSMLTENIEILCNSGSDVRGRFVDHGETPLSVVEAMRENAAISGYQPLTPLVAYFIGQAFAETILQSTVSVSNTTICIGIDPRTHGIRLAEAVACGIESYAKSRKSDNHFISTVFTGIATTPACASFVRMKQCDAAVMVTASHLPPDRNGFKFFSTAAPSGFTKLQVQSMGDLAKTHAATFMEENAWPNFSSEEVLSTQRVNWMSIYADSLRQAILSNTHGMVPNDEKPLTGLKIVLNAGNGAGGFFQDVLESLGADVDASIHLEPDGLFPNGVPNPEDASMLQRTLAACEVAQADLGIMLDTDADRCGFVAPRIINEITGVRSGYEALNRNRLIALLGVVFAREKPGCAVVTDSVTSEGLSMFLSDKLGLKHIRYIKGYANVISRARELTNSGKANAELAIETSGHCAMRENGYLDDGTYTAVKIVSLVARERDDNRSRSRTLLDLIADMEELDEVCELRMTTKNSSLATMRDVFDVCVDEIDLHCNSNGVWCIDKENLEGIRLRFGSKGQFFMLRKSLHDPIISIQIEAQSRAEAREMVVRPLRILLESNSRISDVLNMDVLIDY